MEIPTAVLIGAAALLMSLALGVVVVLLANRVAEDQSIRARLSPQAAGAQARQRRSLQELITGPFSALGASLRNTALFKDKDLVVLERAATALGGNGPAVVQGFVGAKVALLLGLPVITFFVARQIGYANETSFFAALFSVAVAILVPAMALRVIVAPYLRQLRRGLPDALDLLVVCAEAGLGIETALQRVSTELGRSNRAMAHELAVLSQELRLLPDRSEALARFASRSSDDRFRQIAATLSQTLRHGTPLAQAMRTLASDLRTQRLLRLEERAVRLPALLTVPLIFFMLPTLFIALAAPFLFEVRNLLAPE